MAIRTVVTRGFGNGTFNGTITLVVLRGYSNGLLVVPSVPGLEYTAKDNRLHYTAPNNRLHYTADENRLHYTTKEED